MNHAMIMAGGAGKRLWPLSRQGRPKQLLPLIEGRSLMELAVERLVELFDPANVLVITNAEYADQVSEVLPQLPRANIVGEPMGRDTASAVALGAEIIAGRDEDGTMAVFTADHVIRPTDKFLQAVDKALQAARQNADALLTLGVKPTCPHTGYGYVRFGRQINPGVFEITDFREKPDLQTAQRYLAGGDYYWNSGMFVWQVQAIRQAIEKFLPDTGRRLQPVCDAVRQGRDIAEILKAAYPSLQKISIDYAVMEKAPKVLAVELDCQWLDVGSWPALEAVLGTDKSGNVAAAVNTACLDSTGNIMVAEDGHLIALLGVRDLVVVHSKDATLVCPKDQAQHLKKLVDQIEKDFGSKFS
ncbi:MAG: mannose-1-phosphate guanylyltransferase [Planctomycetes bacterium]|nr:mannose-1-phosphate guanylyltransferase [Planctomycetota bacterium]